MTDAELTELAKELFQTFARFEYALKQVGFHTGEGDATPHWRNFAVSIEQELGAELHPDLTAAVKFILAEPFSETVRTLESVLSAGAAQDAEAVALIRELIQRIVASPTPKGDPMKLEVFGNLAVLLEPSVNSVSTAMVAGARNGRYRYKPVPRQDYDFSMVA